MGELWLVSKINLSDMRSGERLGHDERLAVGAGQELVGVGSIDERLRLRVHRQLAAEAILETIELQTIVLGEVLLHALKRLIGLLAVAESLGLAVERHSLAKAVRDVGQVTERA